MCGRFVAMTDPDGFARWLVVDDREAPDLPASYNVAPTDEIYAAVVRDGHRTLVTLRWGLVPHWADDARGGARLINARAETAPDRPAFRDAFARKRCLIPADGFYEWRAGPGGARLPHYIHAVDGHPLAFAGLWSSWRDPADADAATLRTATILTTCANRRLADLHDRMPVILPPDVWDEWLAPEHPDPRALRDLLGPAPEDALAFHAVTPEVNSPRHNHPGLVAPVAQQLRLTD